MTEAPGELISYDLWTQLTRLISWVVKNWAQPDQGIWEVRGGRQDFLFSRVMCWGNNGRRIDQRTTMSMQGGLLGSRSTSGLTDSNRSSSTAATRPATCELYSNKNGVLKRLPWPWNKAGRVTQCGYPTV